MLLKKLLDEKFDVVAVVTQPDKVRGRREAESFSPVKNWRWREASGFCNTKKSAERVWTI